MWLYTLNYSTPLETHWRQLCTHNSNVSKKCTRLYRHECCQWIPWEWKCMGNQIEIDFQNSIIKPLACEWLYVKACCSSFEPISSFLHLLPPLLMSFAFSLFMNLFNKKKKNPNHTQPDLTRFGCCEPANLFEGGNQIQLGHNDSRVWQEGWSCLQAAAENRRKPVRGV